MSSQQLVARIRRSSKYWGQTPYHQWFDVRMVTGDSYQLRGNNNNYRVIDVFFGVRTADGQIVDLANGKVIRPAGRETYCEYDPFRTASSLAEHQSDISEPQEAVVPK